MADGTKTYSTPWTAVLLLCGKCGRKMNGGYGEDGEASLRATLKRALKESGHKRDTHVIETRCMGICPKNAVTALNANVPGRLVTIPRGTAPDHALALLTPASREV